jgi:hypothetical protein
MPYKIYLRPAYSNELYHHGIKGQKWGVRRFQNPDGSWTEAGKKRYSNTTAGAKRYQKDAKKEHREVERSGSATGRVYLSTIREQESAEKSFNKVRQKYGIDDNTDRTQLANNVRKKLDRYESSVKDAKANRDFWRAENKEAVSYMKKTTKEFNEKLEEYGKKPLNSIPTKTLKDGEEILNGRIFSVSEKLQKLAFASASMAGGLFVAAAIGSPIAFYAMPEGEQEYVSRHRRETETRKGHNRFANYQEYAKRKKQGYYK